jgi:aryl-alcohol dehydrogenase-like predicted oxidoreductase
MEEAVTCAIPGARTVTQANDNAAAASLPALTEKEMAGVRAVYDAHIRPLVHDQW